MIQCMIDGRTAYPDMKSNIKVTFENPCIKDRGEYTYQITFPMRELANIEAFGNVHRPEVRKRLPSFEECRLLVDNRLVISGKGVVIGITNDSVKLQITGGNSRIKYNSKMESHYIDEIDFPQVVKDKMLYPLGIFAWINCVPMDLRRKHTVGQEGVYALNPVYDETNDVIANNTVVVDDKAFMYNVAVQPYLIYVLDHVLEAEGFTVQRNDFDTEPWNRLVICNARKTTDIKLCLPHWSVYTFIEEVRKFFNATFIFDEVKKTVEIRKTDEITSHGTVSYQCIDEFSVEHNEDGLKNIATSNMEYEFAESENRGIRDFIPLQVQKKFPVREYADRVSLEEAAAKMSQMERMTTIFKAKGIFYYYSLGENGVTNIKTAGFFNPLVRNEESDSFEKLRIVPVAMAKIIRKIWGIIKWDERPLLLQLVIPSMANDKEADLDKMTEGEGRDEYYVSVEDALMNTDLAEEEEEESDEKIEVMFQAKTCYNYKLKRVESPETEGEGYQPLHRYPVVYTDYRMFPEVLSGEDRASLALCEVEGADTLGNLMSSIKADTENLVCFRFVTDDIPSPRAIFVFHNKRYICEKIEIEVGNNGIDPVKTGYFYELY